MRRNSYLIPRRTMLTGAGMSVALPLLDIMSPAISHAKPTAQPSPRLCVLYKGCGVNPHAWDIVGGTETDFDGKYTIKASEGDVLSFSFLGMKTKEVTVGESNTLNVNLEDDSDQLDEIVVTALGVKKTRKSLTYAAKDIKRHVKSCKMKPRISFFHTIFLFFFWAPTRTEPKPGPGHPNFSSHPWTPTWCQLWRTELSIWRTELSIPEIRNRSGEQNSASQKVIR